MSDSFKRGLTVACCAAALAVGGCTTDGQASLATNPQAADSAKTAAVSSAAETPARPSSGVVRSSPGETAPPSGQPRESTAADSSPSATPTAAESESDSAAAGTAARAWTMTCSDYQQLTPAEKKDVTAELGRRLNKKELRDGQTSWAIVATFCTDGLVRNSPGVQDSQ